MTLATRNWWAWRETNVPFPYSIRAGVSLSAIFPLLCSNFLLARFAAPPCLFGTVVHLLWARRVHGLSISGLVDARPAHAGLSRLCLTVRFLSISNVEGRERSCERRRTRLPDSMMARLCMASKLSRACGWRGRGRGHNGVDGCGRSFLRQCSYGLVRDRNSSSSGALAHAQDGRIYKGLCLWSRMLNRLAHRLADVLVEGLGGVVLNRLTWYRRNLLCLTRRILRVWGRIRARRRRACSGRRRRVDLDVSDRVPFYIVRSQAVLRPGKIHCPAS
jgi:hypothetical protein